MKTLPTLSRRARWAIPAGAVALAGALTAGTMISTAQASPELPVRTPAQLLAAVAGRDAPLPALTGTVVETASLGLPQLPGSADPNSLTALLAGSHTIKVWYADPTHIRLAEPMTMSETDVIRNGNQGWVWQSSSNAVTRMRWATREGQAARPHGRPAVAAAAHPPAGGQPGAQGRRAEHPGQRPAQRDGGRPARLPAGPLT